MVVAMSDGSLCTAYNVATKYEHSVRTMFGMFPLLIGFLDYGGSICHNYLSLR